MAPRREGCEGFRKILRVVKSDLDIDRANRKNRNKRQITTKEFRQNTRGELVKKVCEVIYPAGRQDELCDSFREITYQFSESWKMSECLKKYGDDRKGDIEQAFRMFERISFGELTGLLAVMGDDQLKNLDPIHLVKELRSMLTQPRMLKLDLVVAGYIETIKQ